MKCVILHIITPLLAMALYAAPSFALKQSSIDYLQSRSSWYSVQQHTVTSKKGNLWKIFFRVGDKVYAAQRHEDGDNWYVHPQFIGPGSSAYMIAHQSDKLLDLTTDRTFTVIINGRARTFTIPADFTSGHGIHEIGITGGGSSSSSSSSSSSGGNGSTSSGSSGGSSSGGTCPPGTRRGTGGTDCHQIPLCEIAHTCNGSSGSSSSSTGSSSGSGSSTGSSSGSSSSGASSSGSSSSGGSTSSSTSSGGATSSSTSSGGSFGNVPGGPAEIDLEPLFSGAGTGKLLYVSPSGSGNGASASSPSNPSAALQAASGGDTVIFLPGSYKTLVWNKNGASGKPITLKAQTRAVNIGNGGTVSSASVGSRAIFKGTNLTIAASNVVVDGFDFDGDPSSPAFDRANTVKVIGSIVQNKNCQSVRTYRSSNILFQGNLVTSFNEAPTKTSYPPGTKASCSTYGGTSKADYGFASFYDPGPIAIRGNVFDGFFHHAIAIKRSTKRLDVVGNTFKECRRWCIEVGQEPDRVNPNGGIEDNTSGVVLIKSNSFGTYSPTTHAAGMSLRNVEEIYVVGNRFGDFTRSTSSNKVNVIASVDGNNYGPFMGTNNAFPKFIQRGPDHPHLVSFLNNDFGSYNNRIVIEGRGIADDRVVFDGNQGTAQCNVHPLETGSGRIDYSQIQTTKAPAIDNRSGTTPCR